MKKTTMLFAAALAAANVYAARNAPWTKEKAWEWYNAQPWMRGCNYMPASAANRVDQWQEMGSEERFAEMETELKLAQSIGFNTMRIIIEEQGFAVWCAEHDGFMARLERMLALLDKYGMRMILVLGNDCSRPKEIWKFPKTGPQPCDWGYHGGRKRSQHGSFPGAVGYTCVDDPELREKFFAMCEEVMTKYRTDRRIAFWNIWNEPGNGNRRAPEHVALLRRMFELGWKIDPVQPLAADVWAGHYGMSPKDANKPQLLAGQLSDIISYHCYGEFEAQARIHGKLKNYYGRPLVNTEWLARIKRNYVFDAYPFYAQNRVGCTCWGFVAGKYQTYEPWESMWRQVADGKPEAEKYDFTKWFHDLYRPSLRPYDPKEIDVIKHVNEQMDAEREGKSLRAKIAKTCTITGEDMWYGYRRTKFDFKGRKAWVVEPSCTPKKGIPWTWTMQWAEAFVDRTGVPDLLAKGYHHVTLDVFDTRMDENGLKACAEFQDFLVKELGFVKKCNLIGMSWGGFFSTRYAAAYPQNVRRIYLDAPLLNFDGFNAMAIGPWAAAAPADGKWTNDPRMPVNLAPQIVKGDIPVLLLYGGQDQTVPPASNAELFAARFKAAGGRIDVEKRGAFGHHPHGVDPNKTARIVNFVTTAK